MPLSESFIGAEEEALSSEFLKNGYVIRAADDAAAMQELRREVVKIICAHLNTTLPSDDAEFLNNIHKQVPVEKLNDLRLATYNKVNAQPWFRPTYYAVAKKALHALVGNELAMQNRVNLSVQMPNDESSLLAVHADTWSAETPFQIVVWIPLTDVYDTKSMYILDPEHNREVTSKMKALSERGGSARLFEEYKAHFKWLTIPFGSVMLFSPILLHGNVVNATPETRWSFNCRFTGLFTPYTSDEKRLGTFYLPITTKVVSRVGMNYREPEGFHE